MSLLLNLMKTFYTITLALVGFAIIVFLIVESTASQNGHGNFKLLSLAHIIMILSYGSL
jgi:hypothetical protein